MVFIWEMIIDIINYILYCQLIYGIVCGVILGEFVIF